MAKPVSRFQTLLDKWLSGHFRRSDEAEWNAVAGEDDFAREALEGYVSMPEENYAESLDRLRNRLHQKTGNQPPGGLHLAPGRLIAIAASFAALIGAFWFFQNRFDTAKESAPVAQKALPPAPPAAESQPAQAEAPSRSETTDIITTEAQTRKKAAPAAPPAKADAGRGNVEDFASRHGGPAGNVSPTAAEPAVEAATTNDDIAILEEKEQEKPGLQPESLPSKAKTQRDEYKRAKKSTPPADVKFDTDKAPEKMKKEQPADDAQPSSGWDAYMEYLRLNARLTDDARNKNISGAVRLQFSIDDNGQPTQFAIIKSLGYGCDEEAIRLVKEGSEWEPGKKKTVTLDIKFIR